MKFLNDIKRKVQSMSRTQQLLSLLGVCLVVAVVVACTSVQPMTTGQKITRSCEVINSTLLILEDFNGGELPKEAIRIIPSYAAICALSEEERGKEAYLDVLISVAENLEEISINQTRGITANE